MPNILDFFYLLFYFIILFDEDIWFIEENLSFLITHENKKVRKISCINLKSHKFLQIVFLSRIGNIFYRNFDNFLGSSNLFFHPFLRGIGIDNFIYFLINPTIFNKKNSILRYLNAPLIDFAFGNKQAVNHSNKIILLPLFFIFVFDSTFLSFGISQIWEIYHRLWSLDQMQRILEMFLSYFGLQERNLWWYFIAQ